MVTGPLPGASASGSHANWPAFRPRPSGATWAAAVPAQSNARQATAKKAEERRRASMVANPFAWRLRDHGSRARRLAERAGNVQSRRAACSPRVPRRARAGNFRGTGAETRLRYARPKGAGTAASITHDESMRVRSRHGSRLLVERDRQVHVHRALLGVAAHVVG